VNTKTRLDRVQAANELIVAHTFPWCRARLLHALGAAEEQGVLEDVLGELLRHGSPEIDSLRDALRRHGWAK